mgnify:CR=1 FL=1
MRDISYFVTEVLRYKDGHEYWEACNLQLATQVYEEVKKSVPEAKYYNFEGLQIITTNDKQRKSLLSTMELMELVSYTHLTLPTILLV